MRDANRGMPYRGGVPRAASALDRDGFGVGLLAAGDIVTAENLGTDDRGAFVTVVDERAEQWCEDLAVAGVITDARGRYLRLCPDVLTTDAELIAAAALLRRYRADLRARPDAMSHKAEVAHFLAIR